MTIQRGLTRTESEQLDKLDTLTPDERTVLDDTMDMLEKGAKRSGVNLPTDDRAAKIEAMIIWLILEGRE